MFRQGLGKGFGTFDLVVPEPSLFFFFLLQVAPILIFILSLSVEVPTSIFTLKYRSKPSEPTLGHERFMKESKPNRH